MLPLVSFIIPYYNSGATIQQTIDSIFNQSYPNFEIWIINDGSTDNASIEKLKYFENNPKINIVYQENEGPSVAKNYAAKKANGDFLFFLDSDNKIRKDYVSKAVDVFNSKSEVSVVYSDFEFFGYKSGTFKSNLINSSSLLLYNSIDNCVLMKKDVFIEVGGFDEFLSKKGLEDWELWIRLVSKKYHFYYLEEVLFDYFFNEKSRTFEVANRNIEEIKHYIFKKHADFVSSEYEKIFYNKKALMESPDYRIGNFILYPYRFVKKIFKK